MFGIAAQVSVYPLRSERLSPAVERVLAVFEQAGLDVRPGSMSTVISGDDETVFDALRAAFAVLADGGQTAVMVVTVSNACPVPAAEPADGPRA